MTTEYRKVDMRAQRIAEAQEMQRAASSLMGTEGVDEVVIRDMIQPEVLTLYSTIDGSEVHVYDYRVAQVLNKRDPETGQFLFVADPAKAPEWKPGTLSCFLSKDSQERPILNQLGMGGKVCNSRHIPNEFAREIHAARKHPEEWKMYQAHIKKSEEAEWKKNQSAQTEAMMTLAKNLTPQKQDAPPPFEVTSKSKEEKIADKGT